MRPGSIRSFLKTLTRPGLALAALVLFLAPGVARAALDLVTTNSGNAATAGSLPYEVAHAASGDMIAVSLTGSNTITLAAPITVASSLSISGTGSANLTISGGTSKQIFIVNSGTLNLIGMTLSGGNLTLTTTDAGGAALQINGGAVNLTLCAVTNNETLDSSGSTTVQGGAIDLIGGTLTMEQCSITGNSISLIATGGHGFGGAIMVGIGTTCTVNRSTFSGNSVTCPTCPVSDYNGSTINDDTEGGVIYDEGTLTLNGCLLLNNHSDFAGAVLAAIDGDAGNMILENCVVSGNTNEQEGVINFDDPGTLTLLNCTVTDNTAQLWEAGISEYADNGVGTLTLTNNLIAGNFAVSIGGNNDGSGATDDTDIFFNTVNGAIMKS